MPLYIGAPVAFTHSCTAVTTEAVAANGDRTYLVLVNDSDTVMYISFNEAAVVGSGVRLNANGGSYELSRELGNLTTAAVNCINGTGAKNLCGAESTKPY